MRMPANATRRSRARPVLCFTAILCAREMRDVRVALVGRGVRASTVARARMKNCIVESKARLHCREKEETRDAFKANRFYTLAQPEGSTEKTSRREF